MDTKENRLSIGKVNGIEIFAVKNEQNDVLVPVKPICTALGVDVKSQRAKILEDDLLSSVGVIITSTGGDGKSYEMLAIPLRYVYGCIFSINQNKVHPDARESVIKYRKMCYDVLYDYFFAKTQRQADANHAERAELENLRQLYCREKEVKAQIVETKKRIDDIRSARLDDQPSLFD